MRYIDLDGKGLSAGQLRETDADTVYITPSHQFPTGTVMPVDRRIELLDWAREGEKRYIIEDDYSSEFNFSKKPAAAVQGISGSENVIYLNTFSRILAPSIRIAYMVLPQRLLSVYEERFSGYSSTVPRFEQRTLSSFISGGYLSRHLNRVKNIYRKRRDALIDALMSIPYDIRITGERAGAHLLVESESTGEILKKASENGITLYDISDYYFTPVKGKRAFVAGYAGVTEEDIAFLAETLGGKNTKIQA